MNFLFLYKDDVSIHIYIEFRVVCFEYYHINPVKQPRSIAFYKKGTLFRAKNVVNQQLIYSINVHRYTY